jgi:hypothetical protein
MPQNEQDGLDSLLNEINNGHAEAFGIESIIQQMLWDAGIADEDCNEMFHGIVGLVKKAYQSKPLMQDILNIDLSKYPIEDA